MSIAQKVLEVARDHFEIGVDTAGRPFAVKTSRGFRVATDFHAKSTALRSELAEVFWQETGQVANPQALASALWVLKGAAKRERPTPVCLRVADLDGAVCLDLGRSDGGFVLITPEGWEVTSEAPVLFRRTKLTGPMPMPERGGSLDSFFDMVNLEEEDRLMLRGWMVGTLLPRVPQPILMFVSRQGSGKSTTARMVMEIVDPSEAPLRSPPRQESDWQVTTAGASAVCLDNVSRIAPWLSDLLCRAVSGEGYARRELYTDDGIVVDSFRRNLMVTGIDLGALRGDLLDRSIRIEPRPIPRERRRDEEQINREFNRQRPLILGALLDLTAKAMSELLRVQLDSLPRMADFGRNLAALDQATGTAGLPVYENASTRVLLDAIELDAVAAALNRFMANHDTWIGTVTKLWEEVTPVNAPKGWPAAPNIFSHELNRAVPLLETAGILVENIRVGDNPRGLKLTRKGASTPSDRPPDAWDAWDRMIDQQAGNDRI